MGGDHAWEAFNVVKSGPAVLWETNPVESKPDKHRGNFCMQIVRNITHNGDSVKCADKEIA